MARRTTKAQTPPAAPPEKATAVVAAEAAPDLVGVAYLGPVRRAALVAADVKTRADLARASVDQLVGMTGMGRGLAQRVLDSLHKGGGNTASAPSKSSVTDEAMPASTNETDTPTASAEANAVSETVLEAERETERVAELGDDPTDTTASEFDRVLFAARTAVSDATRTFATSEKLQKPFVRLAKRLDTAGEKNSKNTLGAGRTARIHKRLLVLTDRLETAAKKATSKPVPLRPKREDRLRERVQNESRALAKLMQPKPTQSAEVAASNGSGTKRKAATKPTKKPQK